MKFEDYKIEYPTEPVDEQKFSLEKWKEENPIDYLKASHLLNKSSNEEWDTVYKIIRLYIPDILYKYYSLTDENELNNQKFEALEKKYVYTSESKYLNDPFDNKAYYYNNKALNQYEILKKHDGKLIEDFSGLSRVTSLTENGINSMPMWAHYSNNHKGYCVSYDMKDEKNIEFYACTFPIQYSNERIDITSLMIKQMESIMEKKKVADNNGKKNIILTDTSLINSAVFFSNIKHISWKYENEFRCCIGSYGRVSPFVNASPKEIFIGMECSLTNKKKLISIGKKLNIPVYQMVYSDLDSNFSLSTKKM